MPIDPVGVERLEQVSSLQPVLVGCGALIGPFCNALRRSSSRELRPVGPADALWWGHRSVQSRRRRGGWSHT